MDYLSLIKKPIEAELIEFKGLFAQSLTHKDGLLAHALEHIRQRTGKHMRPILIFLLAKNFGKVDEVAQNAAVGLELLHTASLVHDDVVDESEKRRGQASVNANYDNKVAVLVGDYILSTALLYVSKTHNELIVENLAELGRTLSNGEILQLTNIQSQNISEDIYYKVIRQKTAALFESCASIGTLSAKQPDEVVEAACEFGRNIGMIFQIRDDIFDYYDAEVIGKPTGNDMLEGKLTLPVIHALSKTQDPKMLELAKKVKMRTISNDEIGILVQFSKENSGIEYAEKRMWEYHAQGMKFIDQHVHDETIRQALTSYLDFVIQRNK